MVRVYLLIFVSTLLCTAPVPAPAQNSFKILFFANVNGTLENCNCGKEPLGGVDRLKTVLDQNREKYPDLLIISGGDYFNPYSFYRLNITMLEILNSLKIDLFIPGDQEYIEGNLFTSHIQNTVHDSWFLSNDLKTGKVVHSLSYQDHPVRVYSYLSSSCFSFIPEPENLMLAGSGFKIDANRKESFDIVVFHGYLNEALALAETNPGIELVLLGHDQYSDTMVQQGTTIMGAGRDAEYVVLLEVTREDTAWQIGQEKIYLNSAVPADVEVTSWIREYKIKDKTGSR